MQKPNLPRLGFLLFGRNPLQFCQTAVAGAACWLHLWL
jgi:hypothetical protein